jgi:dihydrodiol dehydrogenase / D-xylose 1-dehydrogenase (NADP)
MSEKFRWGIIGPGNISKKFAAGLKGIKGAELYAVASRTKGRGEEFIKEFGGEKVYSSYEDLVKDPKVDAIYIATPHVFHKDNAILCLKAGKPVLCEKPITICEKHTREIVDTAQKEGVFLMEAMWTRFFPLMGEVRELIAKGEIGELRMVNADFGFRGNVNPKGRLFDLNLGGGGLLDVGVYPISFFNMLLGEAESVQGTAQIGETGVDEQAAFVMGHSGGKIAYGSCGVRTATPQEAIIIGTEGKIHIDAPFWNPRSFTLYKNGEEPVIKEFPIPEEEGNGYKYEAMAVQKSVEAGEIENSIMPHKDSLAISRTMDKLRKQWGLVYPSEK